MQFTREEALAKLRSTVEAGQPIIGAGAGTGLSAKCAEKGGADIIIIYNSGRYRMAGRGSLAGSMAYGDANAIVVEMAAEVLPVVKNTPVLAGVNGTDPFRLMKVFLKELMEIGFSGIQNFPTIGLFDGVMRQNLEVTGMSYALEVDMVKLARDMDILTCTYVFNEDEAEQMAKAPTRTTSGNTIAIPVRGIRTLFIGNLLTLSAKTYDSRRSLMNSSNKRTRPVHADDLRRRQNSHLVNYLLIAECSLV